jgi:hypothetical protein
MQLSDYTQQVQEQLRAASALGDERTQQIASALGGAVEASVRLAILDALSAASAEITAALFDASGGQQSAAVTVQLVGDDLRVVVTPPAAERAEPPRQDEGEATARISLRLSESLKADIEEAAAASDISVNTWLVRAAANSLRGTDAGWPTGPDWAGGGQHGRGATRITGWITG